MAFPKELGLPSNMVGKLVRCAYGTRDAGAIWEDTYRGALEAMGFVSGISSPCCFHHPERHLHLVVHGDDFTCMVYKVIWIGMNKSLPITLNSKSVVDLAKTAKDRTRFVSSIASLLLPRMGWYTRPIRATLISCLGHWD